MALWDTCKAVINLWDLDKTGVQSEPPLTTTTVSQNQTQSREV